MPGPSDLQALVELHTPRGDDASTLRARRLLDSDVPPWERTSFVPGHFTASGFVASPDHSGLLLIHHARLRRWLQPGGHIEPEDETVEDAARREVLEETGLVGVERVGSGILRIDAHPIPPRGDEPAHTHFDLAVGFVATTDEIGPISEVLDAAWVSFDALEHTDSAVQLGAERLQHLLR